MSVSAGRGSLSGRDSSGSIKIALHRRETSLSSYQTTCISKHYLLNGQILAAFESHFRNELWLVAFHLGLRFVETALMEIPKHGYFYSEKWSGLREQSTVETLSVCHLLKEIILKEPKSLRKDLHKLERLHYLATQQHHNIGNYDAVRKKVEKELADAYPQEHSQGPTTNQEKRESSSSSITETLLACGDSFSEIFCPSALAYIPRVDRKVPMEKNSVKYHANTSSDTSTINDSRRETMFPSEGRQPDENGRFHSSNIASMSGNTASTGESDSLGPSLLDEDFGNDDFDDFTTDEPSDTQSPTIASLREQCSPLKNSRPPLPGLKRKSKSNLRSKSEFDLERVLFLSGIQVHLPPRVAKDGAQVQVSDPSSVASDWNEEWLPQQAQIQQTAVGVPPGARKRESNCGLSMEMLTTCFHEDFDNLRESRKVRVSQVPTFQGRVTGSINGCTVIAPLLCIHHFCNDNVIPDKGLPDQVIVEVIDEETPTILPLVRQSLGLVKDAFLIPADAHESLMQQQYMCREQFMTVCGGNILEPDHLQSFLDHISSAGPKKLAASFFFHQHVITILQLRRGGENVWFDVIDSLPHEKTLRRVGETSSSTKATTTSSRTVNAAGGMIAPDSFRIDTDGTWANASGNVDEIFFEQIPQEQATRIRCIDVECLKATLLWYACSVFSPENRAYINTYQWDERLSDFDPRVFQAFVWAEA